MNVWRGAEVWGAVAAEIRDHRRRGFGPLITEDVIRFATVKSLSMHGTDPASISTEWPHPRLKGSRIDLVVGKPPVALIEFKYPREPNEVNAAWTMALGEVLKDLYRLASFPGAVDRLFVYVETSRLRRYMAGAAQRYGLNLDTQHVVLHPDDAKRLPTTAAQIIGTDLATHHVTAERTTLIDIDDDLRLAVYHVDPVEGTPEPAAQQAAAADTCLPPPPAQSSWPSRPLMQPVGPITNPRTSAATPRNP